jgi:hypothetical protein
MGWRGWMEVSIAGLIGANKNENRKNYKSAGELYK